MNKIIDYQGRKISYSIEGKGEALLFIHGYLENAEIWSGFTSRFTDKYRVLCVDVPGHGNSEVIGQVHEMEEMARIISMILQSETISKVVVFGHSMGGYITMEFLNLYPEMTRGYCLFHSTCFADNEEKKLNRDREISLVLCGKKMQIIHTNIPKAFASDYIHTNKAEVEKAKEIAVSCSDQGIIALLNGMKARKDHSTLLSASSVPPMLIWGRKDNYISEEVFTKLVSLAPHATILILNHSGHMGFLEEADCVYTGIMNYLDSLA